MKQDIPTKFWRKWIKSDSLKREKMLKPMIELIEEHHSMPKTKKYEKIKKQVLATCLNSYFEDLYYTTISNKKKK
ncbi:MAG: hypothetical protein NT120_03885 [Candidatus Aenigmarchaeota archaeon]|nr:hypothetical protein [Candidatus Aenigmarchaeota archaeon]